MDSDSTEKRKSSSTSRGIKVTFSLAVIAGIIGFFVYGGQQNLHISLTGAMTMFFLIWGCDVIAALGLLPGIGQWLYILFAPPFIKWLLAVMDLQATWLTTAIYITGLILSAITSLLIIVITVLFIIKKRRWG